jgi:hypothetical protein
MGRDNPNAFDMVSFEILPNRHDDVRDQDGSLGPMLAVATVAVRHTWQMATHH